MMLPPRVRRLVLTTHIATSVGWMGAVLAYVGLDVTAATTQDVDRARAAYVAMEVTATSVIVPLALISVVIGVINALGTPWGLFRHYWVLVKLLLTLIATAVLLAESRTISALARAAQAGDDPRMLPGTLVHSVGGLLVLLVIMILSVYKPKGMTRYGWRKQQEQRRRRGQQPTETLSQ